jgi:hypothetical protein
MGGVSGLDKKMEGLSSLDRGWAFMVPPGDLKRSACKLE